MSPSPNPDLLERDIQAATAQPCAGGGTWVNLVSVCADSTGTCDQKSVCAALLEFIVRLAQLTAGVEGVCATVTKSKLESYTVAGFVPVLGVASHVSADLLVTFPIGHAGRTCKT